MKLPDAGAMILDRKTSTCWKVEVSERRWLNEDSDAYQVRMECVGYNGVELILEDEDVHDDETRYVELEPLQVLEHARFLTGMACSCTGKPQRELCLKAIWLLQWFSAED